MVEPVADADLSDEDRRVVAEHRASASVLGLARLLLVHGAVGPPQQ
jgi:hypothetical protein